MWQAVRASSAAPYYLDDFKCGNDRSAVTSYSRAAAHVPPSAFPCHVPCAQRYAPSSHLCKLLVVASRFQDGAASANNPAALALTQARLLWPDTPINCLVSLGSGAVPLQRREKSMSAYLDIGSVLIEVTSANYLMSCDLPSSCPGSLSGLLP